MRHKFQFQVIAVLLSAAAVIAADHRLLAADATAPTAANPSRPSTVALARVYKL
jgi:hypothetical protein